MSSNAANCSEYVPQLFDSRIYESSVAGLLFRKKDFTVSDKETTYNEVNFSKADKNYSIVKVEKDVSDPEYNEKRLYVIKQQPIRNRMFTMYYYENQFKIAEKIFPMDIIALGIK